MSPPFAFSDVTMSVFPLRASLSRLDTFCNNYLNQAPHMVQFKPFIPFVYLVILDYGRMSLQAANMGWVSQREVAFGIPLRWLNMTENGADFHDWAFTSPFIFVDNEMSMSTGREVYGWPKLLAKLDPSVSEWVRDPHGARRVFQVSTKRAAHAYAGEIQEYRPFLSVYQHRAAGLFDLPPSMETITKPLQQLSQNVAGFTRLGGDLVRTFAGMASDGITGSPVMPDFLDRETFRQQLEPEKLKSWANFKEWVPGMRDMLWSLFPRTYANTINFKQFRDAGDPHATCYQAITSARMPVKSVTQGGLLGPQNMLLGQLDGGFRIDVHSLAGLPIVESLGLEVAEEREADGTLVSSLTPVCPLWMQVDMTYGLADTLVWRGREGDWNTGELLDRIVKDRAAEAPQQADTETPPPPENESASATVNLAAQSQIQRPSKLEAMKQDPDELEDAFDLDYIRTMNFFNTARGATEAIGGAFTMPNASIRVLPLKADSAALNTFVSNYLRVEKHMRFEAWGDFVYLIICDFDQMNSTVNAISKRRAREINLAVPVKCYTWFDDHDEDFKELDPNDPRLVAEKAARHMVTTGFVSAFSFVDDTGTAITASEVAGIPTMGSRIISPENDWLRLDRSKDRVKRDILDMSAHVLPALMSGAEAQERSIVQIHSHTPPQTKVHETQHESVNKWVGLLAEDLRAKTEQKTMTGDCFDLARGFVLKMLGGDLPINQFSLKQFRDSRHTLNACYQGLVQRAHCIQKLGDFRELEEPLHVSITDYPTQPITEILGLKPKYSYPGPDRIVRVFEALRPFSLTADLVREAGHTLFERVNSENWVRGEIVEQVFGWRKANHQDGLDVLAHASSFTDERPVELSYSCKLPNRDKIFHMKYRKVAEKFLKKGFSKHLLKGEVSDLMIRERDMTGHVSVARDTDLLDAVTKGEAEDIAAFNAQVRKANRETELHQSRMAEEMALVTPATVLDAALSHQWGLAPGSTRRRFYKPEFCVSAETVPNQFTDPLFPRPERLHGYWPMTQKFHLSEISRRSAEVLSFKSELFSFLGAVGAYSVMTQKFSGQDVNQKDLNRHHLRILEVLSPHEQAQYAPVAQKILKSKTEIEEKYGALFNAFSNTILPTIFAIEGDVEPRSLLHHVMDRRTTVSSADWKMVEAALPRLTQIAGEFLGQSQDFVAGLQELSDMFADRLARNIDEMEQLEAAMPDESARQEFYLDEPDALLSTRLTDLVTGGALRKDH